MDNSSRTKKESSENLGQNYFLFYFIRIVHSHCTKVLDVFKILFSLLLSCSTYFKFFLPWPLTLGTLVLL